MEIKNRVFLIFLMFFLALFIFNLGYFLGKEIGDHTIQGILMDPTQSELIDKRYFNIIGTVSQIANRTLTLSAENETIDILVEEEAIIRTILLEQGEVSTESAEEVEFENIKVGDNVSVFVEEKEGELSGINVFIYPIFSAE